LPAHGLTKSLRFVQTYNNEIIQNKSEKINSKADGNEIFGTLHKMDGAAHPFCPAADWDRAEK